LLKKRRVMGFRKDVFDLSRNLKTSSIFSGERGGEVTANSCSHVDGLRIEGVAGEE
jgi:hypothetical protein